LTKKNNEIGIILKKFQNNSKEPLFQFLHVSIKTNSKKNNSPDLASCRYMVLQQNWTICVDEMYNSIFSTNIA